MPFRSSAQRRFLYAKHPDIAERWEKEFPNQTGLPEHVKKKTAKIPRVVRKYKSKVQKYKLRK